MTKCTPTKSPFFRRVFEASNETEEIDEDSNETEEFDEEFVTQRIPEPERQKLFFVN